MAKRRIKGKYERYRLRPGKDDDLYDAIDYQVEVLKQDFADVVRNALRAYLHVGYSPDPILQEQRAPATKKAAQEPPKMKLTIDDEEVPLIKKEMTIEDINDKLNHIFGDN
jgi:hypothetical protein